MHRTRRFEKKLFPQDSAWRSKHLSIWSNISNRFFFNSLTIWYCLRMQHLVRSRNISYRFKMRSRHSHQAFISFLDFSLVKRKWANQVVENRFSIQIKALKILHDVLPFHLQSFGAYGFLSVMGTIYGGFVNWRLTWSTSKFEHCQTTDRSMSSVTAANHSWFRRTLQTLLSSVTSLEVVSFISQFPMEQMNISNALCSFQSKWWLNTRCRLLPFRIFSKIPSFPPILLRDV